MENNRVVIIGGGPGGYVAAIRGAQNGLNVTLIEKDKMGGTCLNRGCIPTKTLVASSERYRMIKNSEEMGIIIDGEVKVDWNKILERKDSVVNRMRLGIEGLFKQWKINLIRGKGTLTSQSEVLVEVNNNEDQIIKADKIILATGSKPADLPGLKIDKKFILSSDDILEIKEIPPKLLIVGGGVVGMEFAVIFASLGVEVTVVEILDRILANVDKLAGQYLLRSLKKNNVSVKTKTHITNLNIKDNEVEVILSDDSLIKVDKVLLSVGRSMNTDDLGLENAGVGVEKGRIIVDDQLKTNVENIYAIGDITGKYMLAHTASYQAGIAIDSICNKDVKAKYDTVPSVIFTHPEIAEVGLGDKAAKEKNIDILTGMFPMAASGKANAMNEPEGMVKIVADKSNNKIIGATVIGTSAAELIHELAMIIECKIGIHEVANVIHAHPTLSEINFEAIEDCIGLSVHKYGKRKIQK